MLKHAKVWRMLCYLPLAVAAGTASGDLRADELKSTPDQLVEELQQAVRSTNRTPGWESVDGRLIEQGNLAIPSIQRGLLDTNRFVRGHLVYVLARIGSEDALMVLLDRAINDQNAEVARAAAAELSNRDLPRALSDRECEIVASKIELNAPPGVGSWVRLAAKAPKGANLQRRLIRAVVSRLATDSVEKIKLRHLPVHGMYVTHEASSLIGYGQACAGFDQAILRAEAATLLGQPVEKRTRQWVLVCLAYGGDGSHLEELKGIVEDTEEDSSIRAVALRGYATAAPAPDAIHLLEKYEHDTTPGPDPRQGPLKVVAHDELFRRRAK